MTQTHRALSPLRETNCINCHEELLLNLAERRGDDLIVCPKCKKSSTIKEAENFMRSISPIIEGSCPACYKELTFDLNDRIGNKKIKCPVCGDSFYIDEVENPNDNSKIPVKIKSKKEDTTYSILKYYFPEVRKGSDAYGTNYYIKEDSFNKSIFLTWFTILNLSLPLIISLANKPTGMRARSYTFGDWFLDFLGWALGFLIPSLIVAWVIAKNVRGERKLSKVEIDGYKDKYTSKQ